MSGNGSITSMMFLFSRVMDTVKHFLKIGYNGPIIPIYGAILAIHGAILAI